MSTLSILPLFPWHTASGVLVSLATPGGAGSYLAGGGIGDAITHVSAPAGAGEGCLPPPLSVTSREILLPAIQGHAKPQSPHRLYLLYLPLITSMTNTIIPHLFWLALKPIWVLILHLNFGSGPDACHSCCKH